MTHKIPAIVLGGTGYVSGELIRLILGHPTFTLAGVLSDSSPGEPAGKSFPHLAGALGSTTFKSQAEIAALIAKEPTSAVFCAAPHGAAAALIDSLLKASEAAGTQPRFVDISADYRYSSAAAYEAVYKHPHGAPHRLAQFTCAVPEHLKAVPTTHVAHPGCFSTSILLASVPLLSSGFVEPTLFVSGVTGSTGSGRKPVEGTHHPTRHSDLYSYGALGHRHTPEITALAKAASGVDAEFSFVPHSGPFARGIHATVQARLKSPRDAAAMINLLREYYAGCPFVRVLDNAPRVKDIVRGGQRPHGRRDERGGQLEQGRRGRRRAVDESPVQVAGDRRPHGAGAGLDVIR
jgi:N-acetyl-gamma-glutamyl-phosphate reductase